ncbi:MAG: sulfotransferase [Actinobacteria bacterium]|nr:sulfotransferase [Actinomycetota bacterium]
MRSGTTSLAWSLGSHPEVFPAPETERRHPMGPEGPEATEDHAHWCVSVR